VLVSACSPAPAPPDQPPHEQGVAEPSEGTGAFGRHAYTYLSRPEGTLFMFEPAIPSGSADLLLDAMRHVLVTDMGVAGRMEHRQAGQAMRFIAGSGFYDVTPIRETDRGPITALMVERR